MDGKEPIYAWPDGFWCEKTDLEEYQNGRSDDYIIIWVPEECMHMEDLVSEIVENTIKAEVGPVGFCADCQHDVSLAVYNNKVDPPLMVCKKCGQFVQDELHR